MREIVEVKQGDNALSRIVIGDVIGDLRSFLPERRVIIITDANVHRRYKDVIGAYEHIIIGMGETNKTLMTVEKIFKELIALNADRECFILGFGGGIVTDVAGFAASTYMRGVRFGFVATTLLAQVDASVGGKNGVNVEGYKNMMGVFNQPEFVLCDTTLLGTLPPREFRAGMAEIIKAGIIADPQLFSLFEQYTLDQIRTDTALLTRIITAAVRVKAEVVEADEREAGERKKLNLGHTFAHAIEKSTSEFLHGEAVAIGTAMIADASQRMGVCDVQTTRRIREVLVKTGLPVQPGIESKRLLKAVKLDKKRDSDQINLVLVNAIGQCEIRKMPLAELDRYFT